MIMKSMNKIVVALIALFCMGNLGAYTWGFDNKTDKTIVIRQGLAGYPHWNYNIVKPGTRVAFKYDGQWVGYCMHSFAWAEYNPNLKVPGVTENGGLDMYENNQRTWPTLGLIGREFGNVPYEYKDAEITYTESAQDLKGKELVAQAGYGFLMPVAEFLAKSPCRGRDFQIIKDNQGKIIFTTPQN